MKTIDTFGCIESTMKTFGGHYVDLLNPDPAMLDLATIATSLGRECRYGNHCPQFYSVAEHCINAVDAAIEDELHGDVLRAILMHDATEAFLGDMIKPLKNLIPMYVEIEDRFEQAIAAAYGIEFEQHKNTVKHYDRMMLKAEKESLWPDDREAWSGFNGLPDRAIRLHLWSHDYAAKCFMDTATLLGVVHLV